MGAMPRSTLILLVILVAASVGAVWWSAEWLTLASLVQHRDGLIAYCQANLALMLLAYVSTFVVCASLSIPGAAATLTLASGMVFGFVVGVPLAASAATLGATCSFLIARHLLHDWMHVRFARAFAVIDRGIARDGAFYVFLMRLVIVIPFFVVNPVMGLTNMRLRTFVIASFLGMIVNTMVWVNAGTMLAKVDSLDDILTLDTVIALALVGALPLVVRYLSRAVLRRGK